MKIVRRIKDLMNKAKWNIFPTYMADRLYNNAKKKRLFGGANEIVFPI